MKIRIKFKKYGSMKFIGHLDVMRYFQKAIRRADVNICYSGGFSPHQIMSFAAPLGVGITSNGEYVDIEVADTKPAGVPETPGAAAEVTGGAADAAGPDVWDSRTMVERLNQVMSEGFEIVSCRRLPDDAANAMSIVGAADYTICFRPGYEPEPVSEEKWFENLIAFYDQPSVMVMKKTKRGEKEVDLKPLVYELRLCPGGASSGPCLFMKISAGSAANVKPEQILDAYYGSLGQERPPFGFMVQREEVYADMASVDRREAGIHEFVTLEQLGEDIG